MKKTVFFMLALLTSAHLMHAAGKSFTATIMPTNDLASIYPGLKMSIFTGATSTIPINNAGATQVTLIDGSDNTIMACADAKSNCMDTDQGKLLNYKFRANKETPIIVIETKASGGGTTVLSVSLKKR